MPDAVDVPLDVTYQPAWLTWVASTTTCLKTLGVECDQVDVAGALGKVRGAFPFPGAGGETTSDGEEITSAREPLEEAKTAELEVVDLLERVARMECPKD